jgi:hypothetical protein
MFCDIWGRLCSNEKAPIHWACEFCNDALVVKLLVKYGADTDIADGLVMIWRKPWTLKNGLLLSNACCCRDGNLCIHLAASKGHLASLEFFCADRGADLNIGDRWVAKNGYLVECFLWVCGLIHHQVHVCNTNYIKFMYVTPIMQGWSCSYSFGSLKRTFANSRVHFEAWNRRKCSGQVRCFFKSAKPKTAAAWLYSGMIWWFYLQGKEECRSLGGILWALERPWLSRKQWCGFYSCW